jgi:hypothetical protein
MSLRTSEGWSADSRMSVMKGNLGGERRAP